MRVCNLILYPNIQFSLQLEEQKVNILSDETLTGYPHLGEPFRKCFTVAHRLAKCFPEARVIVGFRRAEAWLPSLYNQYIKVGGIELYSDWYEGYFDENYLQYEVYIQDLRNMFPDVFVYDYDTFKDDPHKVLQDMADFIEVDMPDYEDKHHNIALSDRQMNIMRNMNKLFKSKLNTKGVIPRTTKFNPRKIIEMSSKMMYFRKR